MKANELRIGNLVYHNHSLGMKLPAEITEGKDIDMCDEFEPIPLTEEWLLKLGFISKPLDWFIKDGIGIFLVPDKQEIRITFQGSIFVLQHKQLHKFQNLFYDLTQTELTIK